MSTFAADVVVDLKPVVNDPQGITVRDALRSVGFSQVQSVRVGKFIRVVLEAADAASARAAVEAMCERLLRNPVIEDSSIVRLEPITAAGEADEGQGDPMAVSPDASADAADAGREAEVATPH
jgi:phosphoribosylformylglycinamidine synthase PurS subunit